MNDDLCVTKAAAQGFTVSQVSVAELDREARNPRRTLDGVNQRPDLTDPRLHKALTHSPADDSRGPGHKDCLFLPVHALTFSGVSEMSAQGSGMRSAC